VLPQALHDQIEELWASEGRPDLESVVGSVRARSVPGAAGSKGTGRRDGSSDAAAASLASSTQTAVRFVLTRDR
jgi:hypothetical protein